MNGFISFFSAQQLDVLFVCGFVKINVVHSHANLFLFGSKMHLTFEI